MVRKPTIKDVAEKSKTSVATVSRVLNGLDGYSEETRKTVMAVVEELGYQVNAVARNLKVKESRTIGILMPRVDTTFYIEILNGIEDYAHLNGYSAVICNVGPGGERTSEYLKALSQRQIDGIIVCSIPPDEETDRKIIESRIPCVLVSTLSHRYNLPYVKVDDFKAAYAAVSYLIEKGHKKIAMLGGTPKDAVAGKPRINGYIQAIKDNNFHVNEKIIKHGGFSFHDGIRSMNELLDEDEEFTAIFAASDDVAVGALSVAHKRGIRIPEDVSVIGYDNTKSAEMAYPPLTVLAQPLYEMGKKAAEILIKKIISGTEVESVIMPFSIVERDSVRKIDK